MSASFTVEDVLDHLDHCLERNPCWSFINLEHPYVYTASSRLTLYADEHRWAVIGEVSGFNPRADHFSLTLTFFGNALKSMAPAGNRGQYTYNVQFIALIPGSDLYRAVDHIKVASEPCEVAIREQRVQVPSDGSAWMNNIQQRSGDRDIRAEDIGRYVAFEYADLCRATDDEKRTHLPLDLPALMTIDEWHHRSWYYAHTREPHPIGDPPSSYETFRLIARALVSRDPLQYTPTLAPNNHWSHWPAAGML